VDQVRNSIGDLHEHIDARIRDSLSVATVARLKGEKRNAESVFDAGTIFITRNSVLCARVIRALSIGRGSPDPRFTIATDGQLAGVLWFVSGIGSIDLSRRRLIANCSSAVLPKKEVVSRITEILMNISVELGNQFETLMTDRRASLCPMRVTAGIVDAIDENASLRVLEAMKEELVAPVAERASAAEAALASREYEIQQEAAKRKTEVAVMQNVLADQQIKSEQDQRSFNDQLAQLEFNLETKERQYTQSMNEVRDHTSKVDRQIREAEERLESSERRAVLVIRLITGAIAMCASLISIIWPDYTSVGLRILLALIYLASVKFVSKWLKFGAQWFASKMFKSQRLYIAGLRAAQLTQTA
jgi:hypothetical protein